MEESYFTIGMAGHIDHGKTTLTKALTHIDTDRLKEEKERKISIELGYAPLELNDGMHVSIIDVPGHERFIRKMIAGVAGIDLVVLVIAADEGVMPQTKEHVEILEFLGVKRAIIAITKVDRVDEEMLDLVELDIKETLTSSVFQQAEIVHVDSLSGKGLDELKETIVNHLGKMEVRDRYGSFRMPVDQVFTVQGQGTVARGTVYEGFVKKASELTILPSGKTVRARNIQVHHEDVGEARAGQRAAINLGGVNTDDVQRGDVIVASDHFLVTDVIDVAIQFVDPLDFEIKQRSPIKLHVGASEVMGKIVFFDRNSVQKNTDEVLCQIRLEEEIVVRRGDRFILRRPTPVETIGGGWIIDPMGKKYRFGAETITMLQQKKEGTPTDLVVRALEERFVLSIDELVQATSLDENEVKELLKGVQFQPLTNNKFTLEQVMQRTIGTVYNLVETYHLNYPMRLGINKAEVMQSVGKRYPTILVDYSMDRMVANGDLKKDHQFIFLSNFKPHITKKWQTRMEEIILNLKRDGLSVKKWEEYVSNVPFSKNDTEELKSYLLQTNLAYRLTEDLILHKDSLNSAVQHLKENTSGSFTLKEAKDCLDVSRKFLIPFLDLLDELTFTERDDNSRYWVKTKK
ncbi:selenocysteine-specific translation elongation factor [Aquibacillus kalidii]|uniref:selenocysteine-specific translation elongation factor n=1 Tax=Aquibacillus kalidii TaxID=2762597 RepID=UPI0016458C85|nr:selenocysteine-specific translation elongation factor [Aquibacillus kalidii]